MIKLRQAVLVALVAIVAVGGVLGYTIAEASMRTNEKVARAQRCRWC